MRHYLANKDCFESWKPDNRPQDQVASSESSSEVGCDEGCDYPAENFADEMQMDVVLNLDRPMWDGNGDVETEAIASADVDSTSSLPGVDL